MRLASLAHEDWGDIPFAEAIWRELQEREITQQGLCELTGIDKEKVSRAVGYISAMKYNCVIEFDGEIQVTATAWLGRWLEANSNAIAFGGSVAEKWSEEKLKAVEGQKLLARLKKALPNTVVFGKDTDDEETHNFEFDAILETPFADKNFERTVQKLTDVKHELAKEAFESRQLNDEAVAEFLKAVKGWKEALSKVVVSKFSKEGAEFTLRWLSDISEQEQQIVEGLEARFEKLAKE